MDINIIKEEFSVNKSELVAALSAKTKLSKKDAEKVLDTFVSSVSGALSKGEKVQLIGFGTFDVKNRPARTARNPRTGAEIEIKASKSPSFKAGKALKDKVNTPVKKKGKK
jgi:DNA-binding protein HU-beta